MIAGTSFNSARGGQIFLDIRPIEGLTPAGRDGFHIDEVLEAKGKELEDQKILG